MTIKLVAIDLDDTLLGSDLRISAYCRETIRQVQSKGALVTLATGRMFRSALPFAQLLNMHLPLITYQGALVKHPISGEVLYDKPVPVPVGYEIMTFFKQAGVHFHGYFQDQLVMESLSPDGIDYVNLAQVKPVLVKDILRQAEQEPALKILAVIHDEQLFTELEEQLQFLYGQWVNITRSKPYYLEVMDKQVNKGMALKTLAGHYHLEAEQVLACGDSYNDLEMIKWAGIGVVMGNAAPPIKEAADYVTRSNDEDGVAEALRLFVLR